VKRIRTEIMPYNKMGELEEKEKRNIHGKDMGKRERNRTGMGNTKKIIVKRDSEYKEKRQGIKKKRITTSPESPPYFLGFYLTLLY
jgi:hypothetical protein